jgi:predicted enzyme related to lactoylglutathione lyase
MIDLLFLIALLLPVAQEKNTSGDVWKPFTFFIGRWYGTFAGERGRGTVEREYRQLFDGAFLKEATTFTYEPSQQHPKGEVRRRIGLFSLDRERKTLLRRDFESGGSVSQSTLASVSGDGTTIMFLHEGDENVPSGWRAREVYTISGTNEMSEEFQLAAPGKEFETRSTELLKRAEPDSFFLGMRTVVYFVGDIEKGKAWYTSILGKKPYFDQPYYVGFSVGGYELGLQPGVAKQDTGVVAYWGVKDARAALERLIRLGASIQGDVQDVGEGVLVATVRDPFGNTFGIIQNPYFSEDAF